MKSTYVTTQELVLPAVPLRDMVVFPHMMAPFIVGRESSVRALELALGTPGKRLFLITQRDPKIDEPTRSDIREMGVVARIIQNLKLPNGNVKVMVEGEQRARLTELTEQEGAVFAEVETYTINYPVDDKLQTYMSKVLGSFEQYAKMSHHLAFEGLMPTLKLDDPDRFADTLAAHLMVTTTEKQALLEMLNPYERLQRLHDMLEVEIEKSNIDKRINAQVKKQMERAQKEYYLNEKVKAINEELGRKDDRADEVKELKEKIESAGMPPEAKERAEQELKRFETMPPVSAEATVSRNYIDWLVSVPWKKRSRELRDLKRAEEILNTDHYGLEKIKERILEFLAVRQLTKKTQSSIICFVGPPGVGKSSLARSIAKATGRKFVRLSLGGVRDEAEVRGHRRTYIGAFPGQIIQMMKKAGTVNPVFLLDEIDKMAMDFRGDPAAALLEVLDPEQNNTFMDHYLDVEFDLSKVMFIATANVIHTVPPALKDRMEVIELSGYTPNEKLAIAEQFLVPRQLESHGLKRKKVAIGEDALKTLIDRYTREAGVRNLEREIASVCRKVARKVVGGDKGGVAVDGADAVKDLLGKPKFRKRKKPDASEVGICTGLAWTEVGGEILETQVGLMKGKGKLTLTGKLGDVMQESARAAVSYVRSRADYLGIDPDFNNQFDLHIHVPEGAIPKDGPSAGITMGTALVSALTHTAVRKDVAMTGEITLRGSVLPVGGIKDKVLAAFRADITEIVMPLENEKDLEDIPAEIREVLTVHMVDSMDDVLNIALDRELKVPLPQADVSADAVDSSSLAH
ncbi:MAG TPA: endopeptidase La [Thermoanaerobaculia bacterium]|jgi:ATP-dependent Lon protease